MVAKIEYKDLDYWIKGSEIVQQEIDLWKTEHKFFDAFYTTYINSEGIFIILETIKNG